MNWASRRRGRCIRYCQIMRITIMSNISISTAIEVEWSIKTWIAYFKTVSIPDWIQYVIEDGREKKNICMPFFSACHRHWPFKWKRSTKKITEFSVCFYTLIDYYYYIFLRCFAPFFYIRYTQYTFILHEIVGKNAIKTGKLWEYCEYWTKNEK